MEFTVRRTVEDDWREVRDLRLEMLADSPLAFLETLESAQAVTEATWRLRASRGTSDTGIRVVAIAGDGTWIGTMGGYIEPDVGGPMLVGVYVTPRYRGDEFGVTATLLTIVESWASEHAATMLLEVHEDNSRALAAYAKHGYVLTGKTLPYPLNPEQSELEMIKRLR